VVFFVVYFDTFLAKTSITMDSMARGVTVPNRTIIGIAIANPFALSFRDDDDGATDDDWAAAAAMLSSTITADITCHETTREVRAASYHGK
jgi:hypothetical protein